MTQTDTLSWSQTFQRKLMAALDAAWAILDGSDDPAEIRRVRDRAKSIGEMAAMVRKVALATPAGRAKPPSPARLAATPALAEALSEALPPVMAPVGAQAEHARRALDKLKGGRRGRL